MRVNGDHVLLLKREEFHLPGDHNVENLLAAALAADSTGVDLGSIRDVSRIFKGVEHRIEFVGEFGGMKIYNDSKGTNPDSTVKALSAFDHPVILIIGGYEKGSDFTPLYEVFPEKVRHALIVGATAERLDRELDLRGLDDRSVTGDIAGAVSWARENGKPGDVLLLSPASASFDQFDSYEERGKVFKRLVEDIFRN
jgi:UDP-N-acetylmuramoylalanine--D-glutamate ligase